MTTRQFMEIMVIQSLEKLPPNYSFESRMTTRQFMEIMVN
jgi:hypothetical protein